MVLYLSDGFRCYLCPRTRLHADKNQCYLKKKKKNPGHVEVLTGLGFICVHGHACIQTRTGVVKKKERRKRNPGHAEVLIGLCVNYRPWHTHKTRQTRTDVYMYIYI